VPKPQGFGRAVRSAPVRIALVGATGLLGRKMISLSSASDIVRIVGLARREVELPQGARIEMFVAQTPWWGEVLDGVRPQALICALGTTWAKAGRSEERFREVDYDLIVNTAKQARAAQVPNLVLISAAGADPRAKMLYLKVKGETEAELSSLGFKRLDILRPGLLKGAREDDWRPLEFAAKLVSPLAEPLLPEHMAKFRTIDADVVSQAALQLSMRKAAGRYTHDNDAMMRAAREWRARVDGHPVG
jgi:uncharacterized protein YbjT (DUF2867 family)